MTFSTKAMMDFLGAVSFHDGRGSLCARSSRAVARQIANRQVLLRFELNFITCSLKTRFRIGRSVQDCLSEFAVMQRKPR